VKGSAVHTRSLPPGGSGDMGQKDQARRGTSGRFAPARRGVGFLLEVLMKTMVLVLLVALGGSRKALFEAVQAGDAVKIDAILAKQPKLAAARTKRGVSLVAIAGTLNQDGEGFTCTRKNPALDAVLARRPALDVFDAALVGDRERLAALLAQEPARATAVHPFGWRPLHFAAFGGKLETVKLLLASGAELDARARNHFDNTALQTAMLCGEADVVTFLLEKGADPNVRQDEGFVPLHEAAFLGRVDLAALLLAHGAELDARSAKGETPLGTAVRRGKKEVADFLRARGAKE
jgi:uncharacterized protein